MPFLRRRSLSLQIPAGHVPRRYISPDLERCLHDALGVLETFRCLTHSIRGVVCPRALPIIASSRRHYFLLSVLSSSFWAFFRVAFAPLLTTFLVVFLTCLPVAFTARLVS